MSAPTVSDLPLTPAPDIRPGRAETRSGSRGRRLADRAVVPLMTLGLLVIAQLVIAASNVPRYTLPTPLEVWQVLTSQFSSRLLPDLLQTSLEIAIGLGLGLVLGLVLGAWMAESKIAQRLVAPYVIALVSTPLIVFAPLLSVWFGYGLTSKVVMVVLMTFGPMAVNSTQGFLALDGEKAELMRSLCATRWQTTVKAKLPNALPAIFTGMKISAVMSVIAVVVAEFIGSDKGLGHTVYYAQTISQSDLLVAAAVLLVAVGLVLYYGVDALARRVVHWQQPAR